MIALYKDTFSKDFIIISPETLIQAIVQDEFKDYVQYLRRLGKSEYDAEKKNLSAATWSGICKKGTRSIETLEKYSNLVVLDIDKLDESAIFLLKTQFAVDPFVLYCFVSPSGKGLKVIIRVNTGPEHHRAAFLHLQKVFEDKYLIKVDPSGKDVSRLCYVSWDPIAIIKQSQTFEVDTKYGEIVSQYIPSTIEGFKHTQDSAAMFTIAVKWVNRNKTYVEGERNVFIHALACALNRLGMNMDEAINMIQSNYQTPDLKWHQSVRSAYFHNQAEYGTRQIKEVGVTDFIAPPYIANFTDDVAADDLMRTTAFLWSHKMAPGPIMDIVGKIAKYYDNMGYIDMRRQNLTDLMNQAITVLNSNAASNAEKMSMPYVSAGDIALELIEYGPSSNSVTTGLPMFDDEMFGGMQLGNFYGFIGMGETFKSVFAEYICFINAINGVPCLYGNGEMGKSQFFERLIYLAWGINVPEEMRNGSINKSNITDFVKKIEDITQNNIFVINGSGFTKQGYLSTMDHIKAKTGKTIKLVVSDGMSQWDWGGKDEISATITNSFYGKDLAKEANGGEGVVHIGLMHVSGEIKKWFRNTGDYVRGKHKCLANMDAYFCMSRLIDPGTNELVNEDDVIFIKNKFYLRYVDKRSRTGVVNAIVNVGANLKLEVEGTDPNFYEVKINKKKNNFNS